MSVIAPATSTSQTGARVERLPLSRFTTLGVGGEAEVWTVADHAQLQEAMSAPYRILGGGSNLVVADEGLQERVIRLAGQFAATDLNPDLQFAPLTDPAPDDSAPGEAAPDDPAPGEAAHSEFVTGWVGGGVPLPGLLRKLQRLGYGNLEGTVGIPAQLGGAIWMNAGTRYGETFGGLHTLEIVSPEGTRVVTPHELPWSYRDSGIPRNHIVTRARLQLRRSTPEAVQQGMSAADVGRKGQPKNRTPGCAFKNPTSPTGERLGAGRLIDEAGLKGTQIGQAMIAPEHANFIVNLGGARADDVHALLALIRERVGVPMELEYELWP